MRGLERHRERTVEMLAQAHGRGHLSVATLEVRVDAALRASTVVELRSLVDDLPRRSGAGARIRDLLERTWPGEDPEPLSLVAPSPLDPPMIVGRSRSCEARLVDPTVSRRHAEVRALDDGGFLLVDLGSANGTWLGGRRVSRAVVRRGQVISLGDSCVRLV